jgi:ribosomal-protein-alanine N-acetyltransferase
MSGLLPQKNPNGLNYVVFIRSDTPDDQDAPVIGIVGVHRTLPTAELGYIFHPSVWGRGYATEAVSLFVKLFWELRPTVRKIIAQTDSENFGSMKVLLKCGFHEIDRKPDDITLPFIGTTKRVVVTFEINAP